MAWVSKYAAGFTEPLVSQVCGIVKRDLRAALDWAGGTNVLKEFISWQIAKADILQLPGVLIAAHDVAFDPEAEGTVYMNPARLLIAVAIGHQQRNVLVRRVQRYLRALDAILRSSFEATPVDFYLSNLALPVPPFELAEKTPGLPLGSLKNLQIVGHSLTEVLGAPTEGFRMAGSLTVIAEVEEV